MPCCCVGNTPFFFGTFCKVVVNKSIDVCCSIQLLQMNLKILVKKSVLKIVVINTSITFQIIRKKKSDSLGVMY